MLCRVEHNDGKNVVVAVDPAQLSHNPTRRTLITFPGADLYILRSLAMLPPLTTYAVHHRVIATAENFAAAIAPLHANSNPGVDLYVYFSDDPTRGIVRTYLDHWEGKSTIPQQFEQEILDILKRLLLREGEDFSHIAKETVSERLRHVVLGSASGGAIATQHVAECLENMLQQAHWTADEIQHTVKELVAVDVASVSRISGSGSKATHFTFTAENDTIMQGLPSKMAGTASEATLRVIGHRGIQRNGNGVAINPTEHGYHLSTTLPTTVKWSQELPGGRIQQGTVRSSPLVFLGINGAHSFRSFLHEPKVGDHLRTVLTNALTREGEIGDGHQLLTRVQTRRLLQDPAAIASKDGKPSVGI